jgi:hypothetical protein
MSLTATTVTYITFRCDLDRARVRSMRIGHERRAISVTNTV